MTVPAITYGVGWQTDLGDASDWVEHEDGCSATLTVLSGTVFNIEVSQAVGNKIVYYSYPDEGGSDNIGISTTTYQKFVFRYRTSNNSVKARVQLVFSDASTEFITGLISSTSWTTVTGTITATGKTLDHIRLYALEATGNVYYDFISFHKGTFMFPDFKKIRVNPKPKLAINPIPLSDTDNVQHLGRANTEITIEVEMESGKTWGGSKLTYGEYLMNIMSERNFQWLTMDQGNFKVIPDPSGFDFIQDESSGKQLLGTFKFQEYDEGDASVFSDAAWYGKT